MPLRWSDLDAYGHVNNVQMLRLLEEVRVRAFWSDDAPTAAGTGQSAGSATSASPPTAVLEASGTGDTLSFVARQEIDYLVPMPYLREPADVQLWISRLSGASLDIAYEVHSPVGAATDVVYARAETMIVLVDARTERPRRIRPEERAAWAPFFDEPIRLRRR